MAQRSSERQRASVAGLVDLRLDKPLMSRETRDGLHSLVTAIRGADTAHELLLYAERYFAFQHDARALFDVIEREIAAKLADFRNSENP